MICYLEVFGKKDTLFSTSMFLQM